MQRSDLRTINVLLRQLRRQCEAVPAQAFFPLELSESELQRLLRRLLLQRIHSSLLPQDLLYTDEMLVRQAAPSSNLHRTRCRRRCVPLTPPYTHRVSACCSTATPFCSRAS